jgi:hypothetical protein
VDGTTPSLPGSFRIAANGSCSASVDGLFLKREASALAARSLEARFASERTARFIYV